MSVELLEAPGRPRGSSAPATESGPSLETSASRLIHPAPSGVALKVKRLIDVAGAAALLVVLGPLMLGLAALVALVDGFPVMFRQSRAGLDGRPFTIHKFRTMARGADALRDSLRSRNEVNGSGAFKLDRDPRVTRLGRILRKSSLDELPQLLDVLRGDMSLVGPRPHPFDDVERYEPWHRRRLAMKPGVTGLWQVTARAHPDFDEWVRLDLEYIERWSLALDLSILFATPRAVLRGEGR
jgi:lipopolysaccharide/colanic/teichoic acid biosynthesis glycosyltransferase